MKDVLISTKGTANAKRNTGIVCSALMLLIGIFIVAFYGYASTRTYDKSINLILFLGLFVICDGIIMGTIHFMNAATYVDICRDRFVGKGLQNFNPQNFNPQNFNIKNEQITNITVQGFWVHIHTTSGMYKVMTDKKTASEIFNYYVELKG